MQKLTVTRDELRRRFWDEVHHRIRETAEIEQLEILNMMSKGCLKGHTAHIAPEVMAKWKSMGDDVERLVREELYDISFMHFSSPTKFALLYFASIVKHWTAVKRDRLGPNARRPIDDYRDYDVEADIKLTAQKIAEFESGMLKLEKQFLQSMNERRFEDAAALLTALEISRKGESVEVQNEVNNWRFDLACVMGNPDMFFGAWQKVSSTVMVDLTMLHGMLEKLLYNGLVRGVEVQLSAQGQRAATRSTSLQQFCDEQATIFLRSVITGLADDLVAEKCKSASAFRILITESFERSRKSSLAVNPYLQTLNVVWK